MDFNVPELGEGLYEGELVSWLVKVGDTVKRGQNLMEVMTDKATMEVPSPFAGTITALKAESGQKINVGDVVLTYESGAVGDAEKRRRGDAAKAEAVEHNGGKTPSVPPPPHPHVAVSATAPRVAVSVAMESVKAAPSVRLMARKLGVDLTQLHGTGPEGRILIDDLTRQVQAAPVAERPKPDLGLDYGTSGTRIKLQGIRRKIAEHMTIAKRTIPHYSYVDECDVGELARLRESLREPFAKKGAKLTYLAFFVKAAVNALKEIPIVNASLDEQAEEIVLHDRYHIGIAVATPRGLIVPVVHDADKKDLVEIARDVDRLGAEARTGRIRLEDLRGGTFTVTSIGSIGGLISTPIINHPEVAILGVGKVMKRPVCDADGNIRPADMVYLSLCFDHRVVDGAVGAVFCNALIRWLSNPAAMLLPS